MGAGMARRKRLPFTPQSTVGWLITYADLCILLLSFFVLLVSMSTIDKALQKQAMGSVKDSFGLSSPIESKAVGTKPVTHVAENSKPSISPIEEELSALRTMCAAHGLDPGLVSVGNKRIVIRMERKRLLRQGTLEIDPAIRGYLSNLAAYLKEGGRTIDLRGYTDAGEEAGQSFTAERSWTVSLQRAQAVAAFFQANGIDAARMTVHGFGHYHPLVGGGPMLRTSEENQRVEIILSPKKKAPEGQLVRDRTKTRPYVDYKSFFSDRFPSPDRDGN